MNNNHNKPTLFSVVLLLLLAFAIATAATATTTPAAFAQPQNEKPNHIQYAFYVDVRNAETGEIETFLVHSETKKECEEHRENTLTSSDRVVSATECFQLNLKKL